MVVPERMERGCHNFIVLHVEKAKKFHVSRSIDEVLSCMCLVPTVIHGESNPIIQQESPPAWTQEAYRPPCSEYSFCCPKWVPPPIWTAWGVPCPGGFPALGGTLPRGTLPGGTLPGGYPAWGATLPGGTLVMVPPSDQAGYPPAGPGRVPPSWTWLGNTPPSVPRNSG